MTDIYLQLCYLLVQNKNVTVIDAMVRADVVLFFLTGYCAGQCT